MTIIGMIALLWAKVFILFDELLKASFQDSSYKTSIINNNNPFVSLVPLDVVLIFAAAKKLKPNG